MNRNDEFILSLTDISEEGKALGRHEGMVVFVKGGIPGDIIKARIFSVKKKFAEADVVEILSSSPYRLQPQCKSFGTCGGCSWQHFDYTQQLFYKQKCVEDAFAHIGGFTNLNIFPIIPSSEKFYYRNKMEFSFSDEQWISNDEWKRNRAENTALKTSRKSNVFLGLHTFRNWKKVLDIDECFLQSLQSNRIVNFIRTYAREHSLSAYSSQYRSGFFRNLVIREGKKTNEIMLNIVTFENKSEVMRELSQQLVVQFPEITTIVNTINSQIAQVAYGEKEELYFGKGFISEQIGKLQFKISARSFFQTNTLQTEQLYSVVQQFAELRPTDIVYDLYCGTGTITQYLAESCSHIFGVEMIESAIADAIENAKINNINNATFIHYNFQLLKKERKKWRMNLPLPDVIVVDPPRNGLTTQVIEEIVDTSPKTIVYVSCNPATQARDCKALFQAGYSPISLQPIDMFPHTTHVENVVKMTYRDINGL
ncbi:MAG: 23S rRNA (uracil(1939)-C(5))-methyltransferase RlmD [Ignavibacteria bacterium]|nr:23S rRNA (uracil(1939)-C(5))-methyltransferase RlmD [Ignavibacteria bacterium]